MNLYEMRKALSSGKTDIQMMESQGHLLKKEMTSML